MRPRCGRRWKRPRLFFKILGAELVEVELPHAQAAMSAYYVLGPCEAFSNLARFDSVRYGYCDPGPQGSGQPVRGEPREGLRPRGAPPHHARQLPSVGRRVRQVLLSRPAGAHAHHARLRGGLREGGRHPRAGGADARRSGSARSATPPRCTSSDMFTISINIAGNGGMSAADRASAPTRAFPWACRSSRLPSRTRTCSGRRRPWSSTTAPAPVAPDFADGKVGA